MFQWSTQLTPQEQTVPPIMLPQQESQFLDKWKEAANKFITAQRNLEYHQQRVYIAKGDDLKPVYPFFLFQDESNREMLVHFGHHLVPKVLNYELLQDQSRGEPHILFSISSMPSLIMEQRPTFPYPPVQPNITRTENVQATKLTTQKKIQKKKTKKSQEQRMLDFALGRDMKETKNICKNFSKAIISFVISNQEIVKNIIGDEIKVTEFCNYLQLRKGKMSNIKQFSEMLIDNVDDPVIQQFNKTFRIMRQNDKIFLRTHSIGYIFNSRIQQINWHLKYRYHILRALSLKDGFNHIKRM